MATSEKIALTLFFLAVASICVLEAAQLFAVVCEKLGHGPARRLLPPPLAIAVHCLAGLGAVCILYGYLVEPHWIQVNTIRIETDKLTTATFRVVHISDLHCDKKPLNESKMVELVNALAPDVIVFTGDALNTPAALPLFKKTMKSLKASLAKVAVFGNFETGPHRRLDHYSGTGFELLDGRTAVVEKGGESLCITGLGPGGRYDLEELLARPPGEAFKVLACHYCDYVEQLGGLDVGLYLAGHTHGGQVALPFYGALITLSKFGKKYEAGLYDVNGTMLYVNRGLGLDASPAPKVRFLARPEIAVFEIVPSR